MTDYRTVLAISLIGYSMWRFFHSRDVSHKYRLFGTFIFSALVLGVLPLWNSVRDAAGPGFLGFLTPDPEQQKTLKTILLCISIGFLVGDLISDLSFRWVPISLVEQRQGMGKIQLTKPKVSSRIGIVVVLLAYVGEGPSIFLRNSYLQSNGSVTLQRAVAAATLGTVWLLVDASINSKQLRARVSARLLLILFFALYLGKGSRVAVVMIVLVMFQLSSKKGIGLGRRFLYIACGLLFSAITFSMTLLAREHPHGILRVPQLFYAALSDFSSNAFPVLEKMVASAVSWVNVIPLSVGTATNRLIWGNLNPLVGAGNDPYSFSSGGLERLFPYTWVPLSSAGQIYGLVGGFGIVLIIGFLTALWGFSSKRVGAGGLLQVFINGTFMLQILLFLQYSTRLWFRVVWLLMALIVLQTARSRSYSKDGKAVTTDYSEH